MKKILIIFLFCAQGLAQTSEPSVSLKEYIEMKIDALDKRVEERYPTRTEYLSEINKTRTEYVNEISKINEDIRQLREYKALMDGKASQSSVNTSLLLAVASLLISLTNSLVNLFHFGRTKKT